MPASERVSTKDRTSREEVRKLLEQALVRHVPQYREPAKEVAGRIGTSPATVASLRQRVPEAMVTAAMLCLHYKNFGKAFAEVAQMDAELHPDAAQRLNELVLLLVRGR